MPSQKARNKAYVAGLPRPVELSPESRRVTASFPDLHVRVWCNIKGVNVLAYIDSCDGRGILRRTEVATALFNPPEVTEELVVDWARRALSAWLERRSEALQEAMVSAD